MLSPGQTGQYVCHVFCRSPPSSGLHLMPMLSPYINAAPSLGQARPITSARGYPLQTAVKSPCISKITELQHFRLQIYALITPATWIRAPRSDNPLNNRCARIALQTAVKALHLTSRGTCVSEITELYHFRPAYGSFAESTRMDAFCCTRLRDGDAGCGNGMHGINGEASFWQETDGMWIRSGEGWYATRKDNGRVWGSYIKV